MHLRSLVTETGARIPCSERLRCIRSPGEAYPYHAQPEKRHQHVLQTSKPHSHVKLDSSVFMHAQCSIFLIIIALVHGLWARSRMRAIIFFISSVRDDVSKPVSLMQRVFMLPFHVIYLTGILLMQYCQKVLILQMRMLSIPGNLRFQLDIQLQDLEQKSK